MEAEDQIIVCVKKSDEWCWYRSERDYWVLDHSKWARAFVEAGYDIDPHDHSERFGIAVVTRQNAEAFLREMEQFRVTREELASKFLVASRNAASWFDLAPWLPSLLVDFDAARLLSVHSESPAFEDYVPDGWSGTSEDFRAILPEIERYWVVDGIDVSARFQS